VETSSRCGSGNASLVSWATLHWSLSVSGAIVLCRKG
jgi:hypothetical protein